MRTLSFAALLAFTLMSTQSYADTTSKTYGGVGFGVIGDSDLSYGTIQARIGYDLGPNFAVEVEAGLGVTNRDFGGLDTKVDNVFSAFIVGKIPVGDKARLLGRLGYTNYQLSVKGFGVKASVDTDSIAVGLGVDYMFSPLNGLRGDCTGLIENGGSYTCSASYVRQF